MVYIVKNITAPAAGADKLCTQNSFLTVLQWKVPLHLGAADKCSPNIRPRSGFHRDGARLVGKQLLIILLQQDVIS